MEETSANTTRRKATRRDSPVICLVYAAIFAFACFGLPLAQNLDMVKESELHPIAGTVQSTPRITTGKVIKLYIFIRASDGLHHLTQDDLSTDFPEIMDLRAGDNIVAHVKHDSMGRDLDWFWELERNGVMILSYRDTYRYRERSNARGRELAHWAGEISLGLFVLAILLRRHFGVWRDKQQSVTAGAVATGISDAKSPL